MDAYRIVWTPCANREMGGIRRYISRQFSPRRARMYENAIRFAVGDKLSTMPQKYRLVDDPLLAAMGLRRINVKSHAVFFSVDEEEKTANVERVIHSKRDLTRILRGKR